MRKLLLAGTAAAGLCAAAAAHAQMPVVDAASIAQLVKQLGIQTQQLTTLENQLTTLANTYNQLVQTYNRTVQIYTSLAHLTNVNQIAPLLGSAGLRNTLPASSLLPASITGASAPSVLGGTWGGTAQTFLNYNQVYLPQAQDFQAQQLQKNANYVASVQAIAQQNLQALEQRAQQLPSIQSQIDSAGDVKAVEAVIARLVGENAFVTGQAAQAQNLLILAQAQQRALEQAQQQKSRQDIDNARATLCGTLNSLGSSVPPACSSQ